MIVHGSVAVPGDKSISHRALILAALADGPSRLENLLRSADVEATARALRALGVEIPTLGESVVVRGRGLHGLRAPTVRLDCANSGTSTRLLAGVVAACPFTSTFIGDESLTRRPMRRVADPLSRMGARIELSPAGTLPMTVTGGHLADIRFENETASAQVKSAILLAALVGGVTAEVREPVASRDHTERMLAARGVAIRQSDGWLTVPPAAALPAADARIPGDPSSAAFFIAAAALAESGSLELPGVCLNPTRVGFLGVLARMGVQVEQRDVAERDGEPVGTLVARPSALTGTNVGHDEVPSLIDELPLVACLASRAAGVTEIRGAAELRVKESDRIATVVANLRALGVAAEELPDGMRVEGGSGPLRGRITTHGDHRIAMAFGVLGTLPGSRMVIDDPGCVGVSFPGYWRALAAIAA